MCQTALISRTMIRMSKRTYNHRLEILTPNMYKTSQLARLNKDLDGLYDLLYSQWKTVTKEDYKIIGGQFKILLETIKSLYNSCKKIAKEEKLMNEVQKLGMNYSALYELNTDIVRYNFRLPNDPEMTEALKKAGEAMKAL